MSEDNETKIELAEIKGLLKSAEKRADDQFKRAQDRVDVQWIYSLGFAFLVSSLTLIVSTRDDLIKWLILAVGLFIIAVPQLADKKRAASDK
jgi:hypothetical protein